MTYEHPALNTNLHGRDRARAYGCVSPVAASQETRAKLISVQFYLMGPFLPSERLRKKSRKHRTSRQRLASQKAQGKPIRQAHNPTAR